jgi:glycosyltransferase involved in cell wall biosynthesis
MPLHVSILVPCYNAGPWLAQCIQSALDQTYPHKEIIVVDDGSTDNSIDIIRSFGDRVRFETGPNRGGNVARNRLVQLSQGEWLEFLDADDYLLPNKISNQIALLENIPQADVFYSPVLVVCGNSPPEPDAPIIDGDLFANFFRWDYFSTTGLLLKRVALLDVGGWNESQNVCQEHELTLRLMMAKKEFVLTREPLGINRLQNVHSVSRRSPLDTLRQKMALSNRLEEYLNSIGSMTELRRTALAQSRLAAARSAFSVDREWAGQLCSKALATGPLSPPRRFHPIYIHAVRFLGFEFAERIAILQRYLFRNKIVPDHSS